MLDLLISTLTQGLIYALISFGVYITYSILDFPDLGVDGTFPLGAAVTAVLLVKGVNPWLTLPIAMSVGALAGLFTGFVHVKLGVRNLLAGIITMTALFSVNLQIAGSNLTVDRGTDTIFTSAPVMAVLGDMSLMGRKLVISFLLVLIIKLALDAYFKTKSGLLLRAVGDNPDLVTSLAQDRGLVKLLGLVISNALVALGGCVVVHEQRSFSATMGTGQLVYGLAAVIIGISLMNFYTASSPRSAGAEGPAVPGQSCRNYIGDSRQHPLQALCSDGAERRAARQHDEAGDSGSVFTGAGMLRQKGGGDYPCLSCGT